MTIISKQAKVQNCFLFGHTHDLLSAFAYFGQIWSNDLDLLSRKVKVI